MIGNVDSAEGHALYQWVIISLLFVIVVAVFSSCESSSGALPDAPDDLEDLMVVSLDTAVVNAPIIQTPSPVIHLADNLDEQDQLGWCIDTRGNGFNEALHAHSCKASGGDVQFLYDRDTRQICSVEYVGFCIEMSGGPVEGMSLILTMSSAAKVEQKFVYDEVSGEFKPQEDMTLCLAVGENSAAAGVYMFRPLTLLISSEIEAKFKRWVIVE